MTSTRTPPRCRVTGLKALALYFFAHGKTGPLEVLRNLKGPFMSL